MSINHDLETKEGWRRFVAAVEPLPPERWTRSQYDAASTEARASYDEERRRYHGAFGPVLHDRALATLDAMVHQLRVNRHASQLPLISLVLDGDSFLGKSTLLRAVGRLYERNYGAAPRESPDTLNDHCPVVNLSLQADMKVVELNESTLEFLGGTLPARGRNRDLRRPVVDAVRAAGVEVVCLDELNFLKKRFVKHQVVNDHLKWLMNQIPATFVFAGVDCASTTLVTAAQTSWRLKWLKVEPFSYADDSGKREWQRLLAQLEPHFFLLDASVKMLSGDAPMRAYLYRRSNGSIGTLLSLLRSGAERAMQTGHERIDIELLDGLITERGAQDALLQQANEQARTSARPSANRRRARAER